MTRPTFIPPVHRTVTVEWDQQAAFRRWTAEFGSWWPIATHPVGGERTETAVFEGRVGGEIYEVFKDGGRSVWGTVLAWEPPSRAVFTWHPSGPPETAGEVELRFTPEVGGTRVDLIHSKWENWGRRARIARRGYNLGWTYVVDIYAGRRSRTVQILDAITWVVTLPKRLSGARAAR